MQRLLRHQQSRTAVLSHGTRSMPITLASRQFSTTPTLGLLSARCNRTTLVRPLRIQDARTYWWSSKPVPTSESPAPPQPSPVQSLDSTPSEPVTSAVVQPTPPIAPAVDASTALSTEPVSATTNASNIALDSLSNDGFAAVVAETAKMASTDYSHLFSWGWPSGTFLRVTSWIQHLEWLQALELATPVVCLVATVVLFRIPIIPVQWRAIRAQARMAPYQEEWMSLMKTISTAQENKDQSTLIKATLRAKEIREITDMKPLASLGPAVLMFYTGIGSFIGAGKLAQYHREVVELGGTGPLAYPGGLFGTGFLEDLTAFNPALLVVLTATTWLNTRRSALDSPIHSKWLARMPNLMTPVAAVAGLLIQFSAAQLLVAWVGILLALLQSYLRRVPYVKRLAGLERAPVQDPKTYEFEPFISSWRNSFKDAMTAQRERFEESQRNAIRDMELRQVRNTKDREITIMAKSSSSSVAPFTEAAPKGKPAPAPYSYSSQPPPPRALRTGTGKTNAKNASKGKSMSTWSTREF